MTDALVDSWFDELFRESDGSTDLFRIELAHRVERHLRRFDEEDRARLRGYFLDVVREPTHVHWSSALAVAEKLWSESIAPDLYAAYESLSRRAKRQREEVLETLCRLGYSPIAPIAVKSVRARMRRGDPGLMAAIAWLVRVDREASITLMAKHLRREYRSVKKQDVCSNLLPAAMVSNYGNLDPSATGEVLERLSGPVRKFWSECVDEFRRSRQSVSITPPV